MDKLAICIPAYGGQSPQWWKPLAIETYDLRRRGIELVDVFDASTMAVDLSRNNIARRALESEAEWLMWFDADNPPIPGAIRRLLDTRKKVVSGLYITGTGQPKAIAYLRREDGRYESLANWVPGEIVPVDALGMGFCLIHRSVFEEIDNQYVPLQRAEGGIIAIHEDNIIGDIFDDAWSDQDGKVIDGVYHERVIHPQDGTPVPFFAHNYTRTEDIIFFERVKRVGIQPWLDTSIEVGHLRTKKRKPKEYHEWKRTQGMKS